MMARYRKGNFRHSLAKRHLSPSCGVVGSPAALQQPPLEGIAIFPYIVEQSCGLGHLLGPKRGSKAGRQFRCAHQMLSHCLFAGSILAGMGIFFHDIPPFL